MNLRRCQHLIVVTTVVVYALHTSSVSATIAYLWPDGQAGAQAFSGSIGMDFTVNSAIDVTGLGVFDHLSDGITGALEATIWDLNTGLAVPGATATFTNADPGTLNGSARLKTVPTITLAPGAYSISSSGHVDPDFDYNPATNTTVDNGGGVITITGGRRFRGDGTGGFPDTVDAAGFYGGGTFEFTGGALPPAATFDGDPIAYQVNAPQAGIQDFGGSAGMDFVVNSPILVSALGAFDADQDGMNLDITVELWARDDGGTANDPVDDTGIAVLASDVFSNNDPGTLVGGSRFKSLAIPLQLGAGSYTINAHGYGAAELLANSGVGGFPISRQLNSGEGLLSFVGSSRFCFEGGACTDFPATADAGPADRYAAGTFAFAPVPEPTTSALLGLGLIGLALSRSRRRLLAT